MKHRMNVSRLRYAAWIASFLLVTVTAATLMGNDSGERHAPKPARAAQKYGVASGADQVLSAVYDPTTNSLRVLGGTTGGGTVTSVGLSMPSAFNVTGSPVTSSGTLSVNWAQPVGIANGGTGQITASAAFNGLAPPTAAGGLIYGKGTNTYGNLALGLSGQCLGSNGLNLVWTACGAGSAIMLGGDLSGTLSSQIVVGLQGHPVSASTPAAGQVLEWSSSANAWSPASLPAFGTVSSVGLAAPSIFSVAGSPVTGSGTLSLSLAPENANTILAAPPSGVAGTPAFRTLAGADIPAINLGASGNGGVAGTLSVANGGTGLGAAGSSGQCLSSNGASMIWQTCGPGTVTSVGLTLPSGFGATGSPVTTTGTLGISMPAGWGAGSLLVGNAANSVTTLPVGASGQCLTSNGATAAWGACGTSGSSATFQVNGANTASQTAINFESGTYITVANPSVGNVQFNFSGPLAVANGGTGLTAPGTAGQCLGTNGSVMQWQACGPGTVTSVGLAFPNGFGTTGSPVTTSGTLGISMPSGWGAGSLLIGNAANSVTALPLGASGQCVTSSGTALVWGSCGSSSVTLQTNGTNDLSQTTLNLANGANIIFSNSSSGTVTASVTGTLPSADIPAINLAGSGNGGVAGVLPLANGGTGLSTPGTAGQCLGTNGSVMQWQACGGGGATTLQTNGANNGSQTLLNLVAGTNITLANSGGNVTVSAASGSLPSSWSVAGTTNTVSAQPAASQDASTLILAPSLSSGGTKDIFDICATTACASKYFWVTFNGNMGFSGNNLTIGASSQTSQSFLQMYGGSTPNAPPYFDLWNSAATVRTDVFPSISANGIICIGSGAPGGDCAAGAAFYGSTYSGVTIPNASTTGTTANKLTVLTGAPSTAVVAGTSSPAIAGIAVAGAGTSGNAFVATAGEASCVFDGATTAGDYVTFSATTGGDCHDNGPTAANPAIKVLSTNAAAGTYTVAFIPGGAGGSCSNCVVTNPSATQTITDGATTAIPLVIKGIASQTADYFDIDDSTGAVQFSVSPNGSVATDYLSATSLNTGGNLAFASTGSHINNNAAGSDAAGTIAVSAATSASHTFNTAYTSAPVCTLTPVSNPGLLTWWVTTSATAVTANLSASGTITFNYICMGNPS